MANSWQGPALDAEDWLPDFEPWALDSEPCPLVPQRASLVPKLLLGNQSSTDACVPKQELGNEEA